MGSLVGIVGGKQTSGIVRVLFGYFALGWDNHTIIPGSSLCSARFASSSPSSNSYSTEFYKQGK